MKERNQSALVVFLTAGDPNIQISEKIIRGLPKAGVDIIEIGMETVKFGRTSITIRCDVRNKRTEQSITSVDKITFVNLGDDGKPQEHGKT